MSAERERLRAAGEEGIGWRRWGPYLSERQWGTVREDYSENGDAWDYFSHDQARSRAYRWGEDGLAGISDDHQRLCFALAFWNGKDPILKERLFGLTNSEGNHGEDVKEYYFYLDSTPTHSYMKYLYKYPQAAYPYADLVETNRWRSRDEMEYERKQAMGKAITKSSAELVYPKLVDQAGGQPRLNDNPPLIFHLDEQKNPGWDQAIRQPVREGYRNSLPDDRRLLMDRYRPVDVAVKVVGVGSVGTLCGVILVVATDDDPLFLQVKEARTSVLEPYAGKSNYEDRGQRVVVGQRIMQAASDIFLGWVTDPQGRHFYIRQLRDAKISPEVELFGASNLVEYAKVCGWALAAAHARSGQAGVLTGYMGKSDALDEAIADFAEAYADQNEQDHAALVKAVRTGRLKAIKEK
ncbi:MAG: DUF2252 family protein [Gammaproteobacteria bacterium]